MLSSAKVATGQSRWRPCRASIVTTPESHLGYGHPRLLETADDGGSSRVLAPEGWGLRLMPEGGWLLRVAHPAITLDVIASETDYQGAWRHCVGRKSPDSATSRYVHSLWRMCSIHKLVADRYKDGADVEEG